MEDVLANQPVVIDNGSGEIKGGIAGEEQPQCLFNAYVGQPKHEKSMPGQGLDGSTFVGKAAREHRGLMKIIYPAEHGVVKDWDLQEKLWEHLYSELDINSADHPVLLTEPPLNPRKNREKAAQVLFETFGVPALYVSIQAVLALYAAGLTTGIVLDSGDGVTHTVPVYQGFSVPQATMRSDVAGRDVTSYLQLLLRKQGIDLLSSSEREIVGDIKDTLSYVALDPLRQEKELVLSSQRPTYLLPDGQQITLGSELFRAPELLFKPHLIGSEDSGAHELLFDSIQRVDRDLRPALYSNIILAGGSTLTRGYGNRLLHELRNMAPKGAKLKISAPRERKYTTWMGGSILGGLSTFTKMWISYAEWQENPDVIHRGL